MKKMIKTGGALLIAIGLLFIAINCSAKKLSTPDTIITAFFKKLQTGTIEESYSTLFEGSSIAKEKPQATQAVIAQTRAAFGLYGKIVRWEKVSETDFGKSLKKITYFMVTKYPVAWEFYFWKAEDRWSIVNVKFNDQVQIIFH